MSITNEFEKVTNEENNKNIDPMSFMTPEQVAEDDKKAEAFIKAFRFGVPEFFNKIKEVFEVEGLRGLRRLEMSLDTYMGIRNAVIAEVIDSNPQHAAECNCDECGSAESKTEEKTATAE